jgi:hypothetical protein
MTNALFGKYTYLRKSLYSIRKKNTVSSWLIAVAKQLSNQFGLNYYFFAHFNQ